MLTALAAGVADSCATSLNDILKRSELVICAHADALPYSRQGDAPEGLLIDLGRALAAELGVSLKVHFMRLHREPRRGECDALVSAAVPRQQDADTSYHHSAPYTVYRQLLVVRRARPPVTSLDDFAPGRVAVQSGSWAHFFLTQRKIPVWVRFRTEEEILRAVETGEAEAGMVSNFGYGWYLNRHPQASLREAAELALGDDFGYDVAVGLLGPDQALIDRVNSGLARMRDSGIISATLERYGIAFEQPGQTRRSAGQ